MTRNISIYIRAGNAYIFIG